jgi:hypothetical protein
LPKTQEAYDRARSQALQYTKKEGAWGHLTIKDMQTLSESRRTFAARKTDLQILYCEILKAAVIMQEEYEWCDLSLKPDTLNYLRREYWF